MERLSGFFNENGISCADIDRIISKQEQSAEETLLLKRYEAIMGAIKADSEAEQKRIVDACAADVENTKAARVTALDEFNSRIKEVLTRYGEQTKQD